VSQDRLVSLNIQTSLHVLLVEVKHYSSKRTVWFYFSENVSYGENQSDLHGLHLYITTCINFLFFRQSLRLSLRWSYWYRDMTRTWERDRFVQTSHYIWSAKILMVCLSTNILKVCLSAKTSLDLFFVNFYDYVIHLPFLFVFNPGFERFFKIIFISSRKFICIKRFSS